LVFVPSITARRELPLPRAVGCNHRTVLCSSKSGGLSTERHPSIAVGVRFLVAWASVRDLLLCAKHLFVAAMVAFAFTGTGAVDRFRHHATKVE
jgi:hypothetical protein